MAGADAVVVGAGIAGASTALFLKRRGLRNVILVDSDTPGSGASGHGSGIIRIHNSDLSEMMLAERGAHVFRNWSDVIGGDCGFSQCGVMWLVGVEDVGALRANIALQRSEGLEVEMLDPDAINDLYPGMITNDLGGCAFEPLGGTAIGFQVMRRLTAQLIAEGVEVRTYEAVEQVLTEAGRVVGVKTIYGTIFTSQVVIAAGAWTEKLLASAGASVNVNPVRATLGSAFTPRSLLDTPAVFDAVNDVSFVPKSNGTAIVSARDEGHLDAVDPEAFDRTTTQDAAGYGRDLVSRRIPAVAAAVLYDRWAAVDGCTADKRPVLGPIRDVDGLYVHAGGNFKGFKTGPAGGQLLADLIVDQIRDPLLDHFRPERLLEGDISPRRHQYSSSRWT